MSNKVRNVDKLTLDALVDAFNKFQLDVLKVAKPFHAGSSDAVVLADATEDGYGLSVVPLANSIKAKYNAHCASVAGSTCGAHLVADITNPCATADATDLITCYTLLNALKTKYNAHRAVVACHSAADSTNTVTAADATTEATAVTLANELKAKLNLHMASCFVGQPVELIPA